MIKKVVNALKNSVLCTVLGIAAVLSAGIYDYVCSDITYRERLDEKIIYSELNADMHRKYGGYTTDELSEGYALPQVFLGKTEIPMDITNQHPELPVGCEVTCAAAMLDFFGYNVDKCYLADNYMPIRDGSFNEKNGILYGADPNEYFIGNPYGKGYGCYERVIANVLDDYLADNGSYSHAVILDDANSADLEKLLDGGVPVIVWASIDMKPYRYSSISNWVTENGEEITWLANSHTLILTGYDSSYYYFMDCNNKEDIQRYTKESFISRWEENGSRSIVVKLEEADQAK